MNLGGGSGADGVWFREKKNECVRKLGRDTLGEGRRNGALLAQEKSGNGVVWGKIDHIFGQCCAFNT